MLYKKIQISKTKISGMMLYISDFSQLKNQNQYPNRFQFPESESDLKHSSTSFSWQLLDDGTRAGKKLVKKAHTKIIFD